MQKIQKPSFFVTSETANVVPNHSFQQYLGGLWSKVFLLLHQMRLIFSTSQTLFYLHLGMIEKWMTTDVC